MRLRPLASLVAQLVLGACAGFGAQKPLAPPPDPHTQMAALETDIYQLIESEREKTDPSAKKLALDSELVQVARKKSEDMAAKNYLAHDAPDGSTTASIIMDEDMNFQGLLGENIAAVHYTPQLGVDPQKFAQEFAEGWIKSEAHKQNLAYPGYNRTGIGAAVNGDTVYVTQLFATDLGLPPPNQQVSQRRIVERYTDPKSAGRTLKPSTSDIIMLLPIMPKEKPRRRGQND